MQTEKYTGDDSLGSLLYKARLLRKEKILLISKQLRIKPEFLEALEKNDYTAFPGPTFAFGFLRSYASYLELDADHLCALLRRDFKDLKKEPHLHFPRISCEKMFPSKRVVYISLLVLLLLCIAFSFDSKQRSLPVQELHITSDQPVIEEKKELLHETHHQAVHTKLKALGKCWIEIRNKEKGVVFDKVLEAGEELEIDPSPDSKLTIGNAAGVEIIVDGASSGPLGKDGEVISHIPLDSDHLFSHYVQRSARR